MSANPKDDLTRILLIALPGPTWEIIDDQATQRQLETNVFVGMLLSAYTNQDESHPPSSEEELSTEDASLDDQVPLFGDPEHLVLLGQNYQKVQAMGLQLAAELLRYGIHPNSPQFDLFLDRLVGENGVEFASSVPGVRQKTEKPVISSEDSELGASISSEDSELGASISSEDAKESTPPKRSMTDIDPRLKNPQFELFLSRLSNTESSTLKSYYIQALSVEEIASQDGVTTEVVQSRINRGVHRLRTMVEMPEIQETDLQSLLKGRGCKPQDVQILVALWHTVNFQKAAQILRLTMGKVRHRFEKLLPELQSNAGASAMDALVVASFERIAGERKEGESA